MAIFPYILKTCGPPPQFPTPEEIELNPNANSQYNLAIAAYNVAVAANTVDYEDMYGKSPKAQLQEKGKAAIDEESTKGNTIVEEESEIIPTIQQAKPRI